LSYLKPGITNLDSTLPPAECGIRFHSEGNLRLTQAVCLGQPNPRDRRRYLPRALALGGDLNNPAAPLRREG
jgi:hypothetical protein